MRIELLPSAKARFMVQADRLGMTQIAIASRLFEWFAKQDDMVVSGILGLYPLDIQADIARLIMKKFAERNGKKS